MTSRAFTFRTGNLKKFLFLPVYLIAWLLSVFIPRSAKRWALGSGIGVGEGALAVALECRRVDPDIHLIWMARDERDREEASAHGFEAVRKNSLRGFWMTLRSDTLVVTHGLGDVNRFGVFGAFVVNLWHGVPLKKIHLDSPVTTQVSGPSWGRGLLTRLYAFGAGHVDLYVAGSFEAAERLRSAFRVQPGKVRILGDPRLDDFRRDLDNPLDAQRTRATVIDALNIETTKPRFILYAPTWRDGDVDPGIPTEEEAQRLSHLAVEHNAHLLIRPHPLSEGDYSHVPRNNIHLLPASLFPDLSVILSSIDVLITDYSSVAIDFSLSERAILWFAPDLASYSSERGLYEPLEVTSEGTVLKTWDETCFALEKVLDAGSIETRLARLRSGRLSRRFHEFPRGSSAGRVLKQISVLRDPHQILGEGPRVFFESFYGASASCNPLAIDREIAQRQPDTQRFWSVANEHVHVPPGATPVLVGGREWEVARANSQLLVVNDWLRHRYRSNRKQTVLQTWHGTPLKQLALGRPRVSLRTRVAIHREQSRWDFLLSENSHSTHVMRKTYAFRGEVLEVGYPRTDRLVRSVVQGQRLETPRRSARHRLEIDPDAKVLLYAPTWRDGRQQIVDLIDTVALAAELGPEWTVLARSHSRVQTFGRYTNLDGQVRDVSKVADVNDLLLAADVLVTDYSSIMFDASAACVPTIFFVPDLDEYRDQDRGFTFQFEAEAFGPLVRTPEEVIQYVAEVQPFTDEPASWLNDYEERLSTWRTKFNALDDGAAGKRVVTELFKRNLL